MDPIITGALISGGAQLLGGLFGSKKSGQIADMNVALQREMAQKGIQWRVADAQAAGVHPLYAMGAQLPSFSPITIDPGAPLQAGIAGAGEALGRGFADWQAQKNFNWQQGREEKRLSWESVLQGHNVNMASLAEDQALSKLKTDEVERGYYAALTAKTLLEAHANKERSALGDSPVSPTDAWERVPSEVMSGRGEMTAGPPDKGWKSFNIGDGMVMDLPSSQNAGMAEALEGMEGIVPSIMVVAHNVKKYGPSWASRALRNFDDFAGNLGRRQRAWLLEALKKVGSKGSRVGPETPDLYEYIGR